MQDLGEDRVFYSPIYCNLRMYFVFPPLKNISAVLFYLGVFTFCTCCILICLVCIVASFKLSCV